MNRPRATQAAILVVAALILFGVRKTDQNTQTRLSAQAHATAALTYDLCSARNKAIEASNARWARLAVFMQEAASVPTNAQYEKPWQAYAASIQPLPTIQCGDAP